MIVVVLGCYLPYSPFESWWYLRFLLPAAGAAATVIAVGIVAVARALPAPIGAITGVVVIWGLLNSTLTFAVHESVFGGLRSGERRYIAMGEFVRKVLPADAAIFTQQHSGSLRFYGGRMTLRYDLIDRGWGSRAATEVERAGLHPYLLIDDWEVSSVRDHFELPPSSALPWPIVARMREVGGVTLLDLATAPASVAPVALEPTTEKWCSAPAIPLRVR